MVRLVTYNVAAIFSTRKVGGDTQEPGAAEETAQKERLPDHRRPGDDYQTESRIIAP